MTEPVTSPDFFPTLLTAAGGHVDPRRPIDGVDFGPALRGEPFERGPIFWHYPHYSNQGGRPAAAVREGEWKLIHHFEDGINSLYNLQHDIGEHRDLAADEPEQTRALANVLRQWLDRVEAQIPRHNPEAEPYHDLAGYFLGGDIAYPEQNTNGPQ